ncbi:N-myc protein-like [Homarus americanus]|uniref:N-myc protein-like n=1 Tax=Homarus americanus TaxID=6706 RepID=UPI001C4478AB|nr:N-myc protein-like [Homarus americanus]XP_042204361.1 N-myc protein-like [Homarus americanus]
MATSTDLRMMPESWLTPTQMHHHALPEDIWSKFDIEHDRALALANPEASILDHSMTYNTSSPSEIGVFMYSNTTTTSSNMQHPIALPTPPRSPPAEHDLDDLVASIPEILESPSATPPSDISDILSDLEGMEATPLGETPLGESAWGSSWWVPVAPPVPEESLKRDIMWGGGTCCSALLDPPPKERQVSECSADLVLRDALRQDDISEDDDDDEDNLPDTPSGTDSDCDADDQLSETSSSSSSSNDSSCFPPRSTNSASRYSSSASTAFRKSAASYVPPSVNIEHNYCGRVPEPDAHAIPGILTPSDTEDEVDVVSCNDLATTTTLTASTNTTTITTSASTTTASSRLQLPSKRSVDVKRQLQLAIQEAMRNRQNRAAGSTSPDSDESGSNNRFVSVKIKTQGKPAAYTKRMRDYHSEVIKSTKHRRRNRGESDEGRRSVHNSLERQRRVDLRNAFEYLRQLVPDTMILEKAPKVQILKKAALHCKQLQHTEQRLLREKEKLKKQLEELQQRRSQTSS